MLLAPLFLLYSAFAMSMLLLVLTDLAEADPTPPDAHGVGAGTGVLAVLGGHYSAAPAAPRAAPAPAWEVTGFFARKSV